MNVAEKNTCYNKKHQMSISQLKLHSKATLSINLRVLGKVSAQEQHVTI